MTFANQVKETLLQDISDMAQSPWLFSKHPETDSTGNRKIGFQSLLHFCVCMEAGTTRHELLNYFAYDAATPPNSAFHQQRSKLLPETFPFLFRQFNSHYPLSLYKGKYHLVACDGPSFTFTRNPLDQDSYFAPDGKTTRGYSQVHVVALFDILSKRYCDCVVQPIRKKNEFQAPAQMIDRYHRSGPAPIFIADRGFHSFNVLAHAMEHGSYFLVRAKDVNMRRLLGGDLPDGEDFDIRIDRILTRTQSKGKRLHPELGDRYRSICRDVAFDYIEHGSGKEYPIPLRVLRFRVPGGGYENIITNLPPEGFPAGEVKALYGPRWKIETSFRELKHAIGAVNFHSKKRGFIGMEVWARLLLYSFCAIITHNVVIGQKNTRHVYQVNYTVAYNACHYPIRLHNGEDPPDIESLIGQNILPIRHDRNYARLHRFRVPASFTYRFS